MCVVYVTRVVEAVRRQVHVVCVTRVVEAVGQGLCGPRNRSSSAKLCKRLSAHLFILLKQGETKIKCPEHDAAIYQLSKQLMAISPQIQLAYQRFLTTLSRTTTTRD